VNVALADPSGEMTPNLLLKMKDVATLFTVTPL
jgi:hypothetical protein